MLATSKWINFREAQGLAEELMWAGIPVSQRRPVLASLLWHALQGGIAVTGQRWERVGDYGQRQSIYDDDCEEEQGIWERRLIDLVYRRVANLGIGSAKFDHYDLQTGSFEVHCTGRQKDGHNYHFVVVGMQFDRDDLVQCLGGYGATGTSLALVKNAEPPTPGLELKRLSNAWHVWIAELVHQIHLQGIPDGIGSQGQGELIKAIADALAERGIESLSRTTVQPVVQAVLDRLRPAAN